MKTKQATFAAPYKQKWVSVLALSFSMIGISMPLVDAALSLVSGLAAVLAFGGLVVSARDLEKISEAQSAYMIFCS
ncbi:hypothetical protein KIMH_15150 [Bombiscardovia apis]|uniref:Uncharacterized protein n=1 Tax=Bombiscardovia apis TaxID=2932182 RepID=A0ABN6SHY9_9BIFI|nr:hypothetical protein [Bombiscardovia apis]BDR55404.1 hypothetical protein KIMH_15150 [Bombiscardovia apis]